MPRDIPIGNGQMLIAFDHDAILREFYFPHIGEENHTQGEPFRFGVWVDGAFSWVPDGWQIQREYLDDSLVTAVTMEGMGLKIEVNDLVDFEENLYLKKFKVQNLTNGPRELRLFLGQDFHISGNPIGDTAAFKPENRSLIHYKGERYFLINILANNKFGLDFYATGNKEIDTEVGSWKDAEDGILSQNPIAQGSVDSVIGIPLTLPPLGEEICYYWIAVGKDWEEVKTINQKVIKKTPAEIFKRTYEYWKTWVGKENLNYELLPEKVGRLYRKSLLISRTHMDNLGSIIAANDSDSIHFNRDTYSYMWPRDGALVAHAWDLSGYDITKQFYQFCASVLAEEGYFLHKYTPTGDLGSSWHPWIKGKKEELPIQEDETALVLWALWNHYSVFKDFEFIKTLYHPFIRKCADFMMNYRDLKTKLPLPSYDLWEERQGILTFTVSTVYGGLMAASHFAKIFGDTELSQEYAEGAKQIRGAMDRYLYLKKEKRFARMIQIGKDDSITVDATIDASLYASFAFGAYAADEIEVKNTMSQIEEKLAIGGGLARYENDPYYRQQEEGPGNPWFVTTLWMAQYYIALAKNKEELDKALPILEWVADHALPSGCLAEQVNPQTHEPLSVSPLTWSHGTYITTTQQYLNKLVDLEKCKDCGMSKIRKTI